MNPLGPSHDSHSMATSVQLHSKRCTKAGAAVCGVGAGAGVGAAGGVGEPLCLKHQGLFSGLGDTGDQQHPCASHEVFSVPVEPQSMRWDDASHASADADEARAEAATNDRNIRAYSYHSCEDSIFDQDYSSEFYELLFAGTGGAAAQST